MKAKKWMSTIAVITLTLTLSACGGSEPEADQAQGQGQATTTPAEATSTEQAADAHNDADTMFAQMMIVHHEGAIEMSDLAGQRADSAQVRTLAERISAAQGPEIEQMESWLQAWGEPRQAHGMDHSAHEGMDMGGMSQEEAMSELQGLSGTEFDKRFLELMIAHHEGAVHMSQTQLADGTNADALDLAQQIIADQEAEISEMRGMLAAL